MGRESGLAKTTRRVLKSAFERKPDEQQEAAKEEPGRDSGRTEKTRRAEEAREAAQGERNTTEKYNEAALAKLRERE